MRENEPTNHQPPEQSEERQSQVVREDSIIYLKYQSLAKRVRIVDLGGELDFRSLP